MKKLKFPNSLIFTLSIVLLFILAITAVGKYKSKIHDNRPEMQDAKNVVVVMQRTLMF